MQDTCRKDYYPEWLRKLIIQAQTGDSAHDKSLEITPIYDLISKDKAVLKHYQDYIGTTIKHDEHTMNIVFFTALSAYVADYDNKFTPLNLFLKGESSTGKTYNVTETIDLFPDTDLWLLGGLSPKALVYQHGELVDEKDRPFDMSEKPSNRKPTVRRNESEEDYQERLSEWETVKLAWNEKMKGSKYVVDLSGKILVFLEAPQEETFLMLRPILSHDAKEISFRMAYKSGGGSLATRNVVLRGWCATIFCTTKVDYLEELSTRSFTASPLATTDKYRESIDLVGERGSNPFKFQRFIEKQYLRAYINIIKGLRVGQEFSTSYNEAPIKYKVINPFASQFVKKYPSRQARAMRDIQHVLALMNISAMFHYAQRPFLRIEDEERESVDWIMVTARDFEFVAEFLPALGETTLTGLSQTALDILSKVCKPLYSNSVPFTYEELVDRHNEVFQNKRSYSYMRLIVKGLSEAGFVTTEQHATDKRKKVIKVLKNPENPFKNALQDFLGLFTVDDLKSWLESCKKDSAKSSAKIFTRTIEEKEIADDKIADLHSLCYSFSSQKLHDLIARYSEPIPEKKGIDYFLSEEHVNKQISAESKSLVKRFGIVSAQWLTLEGLNQRPRGTCYLDGESKELAATIKTFKGEHRICETCAEQVIAELKEQMEEV